MVKKTHHHEQNRQDQSPFQQTGHETCKAINKAQHEHFEKFSHQIAKHSDQPGHNNEDNNEGHNFYRPDIPVDQPFSYSCHQIAGQDGDQYTKDQAAQCGCLMKKAFLVTPDGPQQQNHRNDNIYRLHVHCCIRSLCLIGYPFPQWHQG